VELPHQCVLPTSSAKYQDTKSHEEVVLDVAWTVTVEPKRKSLSDKERDEIRFEFPQREYEYIAIRPECAI
jgi:hypothetical protein